MLIKVRLRNFDNGTDVGRARWDVTGFEFYVNREIQKGGHKILAVTLDFLLGPRKRVLMASGAGHPASLSVALAPGEAAHVVRSPRIWTWISILA